MKVLKPFFAAELNRIVEPGEDYTADGDRLGALARNGLISMGEPKPAAAPRDEPVPPPPAAQSAPQRATLTLPPRNKDAQQHRRTK